MGEPSHSSDRAVVSNSDEQGGSLFATIIDNNQVSSNSDECVVTTKPLFPPSINYATDTTSTVLSPTSFSVNHILQHTALFDDIGIIT
jgi:hypothetical protein